MAAINFNEISDRDGGSLTAIINWAGAFLSILLIVGLATWGWKLWQRDVTGIPVVRALEGPMRITPAEPGGLANDFQGLAVNRIAEERVSEVTDRVVLAPAPATFDEDEDLAMAELAPAVEEVLSVVEVAPAADFDDGVQAETLAETVPVMNEPSATDMAVAAALADAGALFEAQPVSLVGAGSGAPAATPRPLERPEGRRVASLNVMNDVTGAIDPATIPPGTRLVQLGAYGSEDVAKAEWANALANFGDYMVGKERVVQQAETGGRIFWRLRALGFEDLSDARRFCAVLVSDGANCIPVVQE
ncbi:SPOR domain-containing protein [Boseongicola aestuarii]|uniref:Sporulation related domain protein n=1 Tax=Boseongicola aestuarii TaxID=1470561 RepID=A0A238IWU7_9RHOB|nr:SPOR domain-containing protein [Boseongicola aestuarii]SMX22325.1 Sporulation related domain protein [Boseongicola aestuarii]